MVDDGGPFVFVVVRLPVSAVHPGITVVVSLGEVDEAGVGEDGHGHQDHQQPELLVVRCGRNTLLCWVYLVSLLQSTKYGLEASEMSHELEDSEYPHDSDQPNDLASFPNDLVVLQLLQDQREEEREDGEEVNDVHRVFDELQFDRADNQSGEELHCEEYDGGLVDDVDDLHNDGELLQLIRGGDDECQC